MGTLILLAGLIAAAPAPNEAPNPHAIFCVVPLGPGVSDAMKTTVVDALADFYGLRVEVLPAGDLPEAAFYAPSSRYRAEKLLDFLAERRPSGALSILGIMAVDISTTKGTVADWGIVGLGSDVSRSSVISSFRCKRGVGPVQASIRTAKASVHEVGHTLGLPHCPDPCCLMQDLKGSVSTLDRAQDFCAACRALLADRGTPVATGPTFRWSRIPKSTHRVSEPLLSRTER